MYRTGITLAIIIIGAILFNLVAAQTEPAKRVARSRIRHEVPSTDGRRPCETEQIEYRLTKLEVQVAEKAEALRAELQEGGRRLQALEFQNVEAQSALEGFRNEMGRFADVGRHPRHYVDDAEKRHELLRIDNLAKGVQLLVAAVRSLTADISAIKRNISSIANKTDLLLREHDQLATKQFLSSSLADMRHHHQLYQEPIFSQPCPSGKADVALPRSCKEVQERGNNMSAIYRIQPEHSPKAFMVLCDMNTQGGGWTYIHNRFEGSQDFYLTWHSYKHGFGNLGGEFWLGLEHIHQLTGYDVNELLVELVDLKAEKAHAHYSAFSVGNEVEGYSLRVLGGYTGDAGDSLLYHAGGKFSTKDLDQDQWPEGSCAQAHHGAWWYRGCDTSNLNGRYLNGDLPDDQLYHGMYWAEFRGAQYSLMQARMMVRPRSRDSGPMLPDGIPGNGKN